MADSTDALLEIVYELAATHDVRFEPGTLLVCREIFDKTVSKFAQQAAEQSAAEHSAPAHPWDNEDFRTFILGQVRRIAVEAKSRAGAHPVSPQVFRQASVQVMRDTNRVCRLVAERGKLRFATAPTPQHYEGEVCSAYLNEAAP